MPRTIRTTPSARRWCDGRGGGAGRFLLLSDSRHLTPRRERDLDVQAALGPGAGGDLSAVGVGDGADDGQAEPVPARPVPARRLPARPVPARRLSAGPVPA